ncbi:Asd/ArgC dimerization domain-containing protein [Endozoicomonas sp. Mp262]|uniref:Asd/ArgC dimerization domain-containing protein n=1 Tax=Endozoicomonas sp. Mp262 TaxID=2919499 RepID=UPI0021DB0D04
MSRTYDIALCDTTSLAAKTLISLLEDKSFPIGTLYPLSDSADSGSTIDFHGEELDVLTESGFEFADADLAFIPAGSSINDQVIQQAIESGCMIIDGSRGAAEHYGAVLAMADMDRDSLEAAVMQKRVVIPSSPAALILPALKTISEIAAIERVDITACLAVSRAGDSGINELRKQTIELLNGKPVNAEAFTRRTAYNLIPEVGTIEASGQSSEECILDAEIRAGMEVDDLDIRSTCMIAPVFFGDSVTVSLDLDIPVDLDVIHDALGENNAINLFESTDYPTVEQAAGSDHIMLGRLRRQPGSDGALSFWVAADATRQGALQALLVAETLIKDFLR